MKTIIEVTIKNDENNKQESFSAMFDNDELAKLANTNGLRGANAAIDGFVVKLVKNLKEKLSSYLSS